MESLDDDESRISLTNKKRKKDEEGKRGATKGTSRYFSFLPLHLPGAKTEREGQEES